jgi:hypothetical protein
MEVEIKEPEIKTVVVNAINEIKKEEEPIIQMDQLGRQERSCTVEEKPKKKRAPAKKKEPSPQYVELKQKVEAKKKKEPKPKKEKVRQPTKNNFYLDESNQNEMYMPQPEFYMPQQEYYEEPIIDYVEPESEIEQDYYPPQPLYQIPKKSVKYEDDDDYGYAPPRRATKYELNELYEKKKDVDESPYYYAPTQQKEKPKTNKVLKQTTGNLINLLDEYKPTKRVNIFRN